MILSTSIQLPGPAVAERCSLSLATAIVLRDCSLRKQSSPGERRACRTLMRQGAMKWRHGVSVGRWER